MRISEKSIYRGWHRLIRYPKERSIFISTIPIEGVYNTTDSEYSATTSANWWWFGGPSHWLKWWFVVAWIVWQDLASSCVTSCVINWYQLSTVYGLTLDPSPRLNMFLYVFVECLSFIMLRNRLLARKSHGILHLSRWLVPCRATHQTMTEKEMDLSGGTHLEGFLGVAMAWWPGAFRYLMIFWGILTTSFDAWNILKRKNDEELEVGHLSTGTGMYRFFSISSISWFFLLVWDDRSTLQGGRVSRVGQRVSSESINGFNGSTWLYDFSPGNTTEQRIVANSICKGACKVLDALVFWFHGAGAFLAKLLGTYPFLWHNDLICVHELHNHSTDVTWCLSHDLSNIWTFWTRWLDMQTCSWTLLPAPSHPTIYQNIQNFMKFTYWSQDSQATYPALFWAPQHHRIATPDRRKARGGRLQSRQNAWDGRLWPSALRDAQGQWEAAFLHWKFVWVCLG